MEPRHPLVDLLERVFCVEDGMHDELGGVGLDHLPGLPLAHDVHQVAAGAQRRDGGEVGGTGVHDAAAKDADAPAIALVQVGGQARHDLAHFLVDALRARNCGAAAAAGGGGRGGRGVDCGRRSAHLENTIVMRVTDSPCTVSLIDEDIKFQNGISIAPFVLVRR